MKTGAFSLRRSSNIGPPLQSKIDAEVNSFDERVVKLRPYVSAVVSIPHAVMVYRHMSKMLRGHSGNFATGIFLHSSKECKMFVKK
jgi:hypothetical protein